MKDIAFEELHLNLKHQKIKVKDYSWVGYEFEPKIIVGVLCINLKGINSK